MGSFKRSITKTKNHAVNSDSDIRKVQRKTFFFFFNGNPFAVMQASQFSFFLYQRKVRLDWDFGAQWGRCASFVQRRLLEVVCKLDQPIYLTYSMRISQFAGIFPVGSSCFSSLFLLWIVQHTEYLQLLYE